MLIINFNFTTIPLFFPFLFLFDGGDGGGHGVDGGGVSGLKFAILCRGATLLF